MHSSVSSCNLSKCDLILPYLFPICVPSVLYYDTFFTSGEKDVLFFIVSIIYHFGVLIDVGHFNCTLFESGVKCITFDGVSVTEKLSDYVLLNANDRKYTVKSR